MRPLRIAFVGQKGFPARWGGIEAYVEAVSTRLAARGHAVRVYVRPWYSPGALAHHRGVEVCTIPTIRRKHLDATVHSFVAALEAATTGFDVVHFQAIGPALFSWIPRLSLRTVVTTIHSLDYESAKWGSFARFCLRRGEDSAFRFSDSVVVVARHLAEYYADRGLATEVIPNGIELAPEPGAPGRAPGLDEGDYLLFLGRWTPCKRIRELVEAFIAVSPRGVKLVVAGDSDEACHEAEIRAAAAGRTDVVFPGVVCGDVKEALLAHARAYVSFSNLEGMPIALLEAMSRGRLCLVSDIPAHRELLPSCCGLIRAVDTPRSRVDALREVLSVDDDEREAMGRAARLHVVEHFNWDTVVDRLERLYERLLPRPAHGWRIPRHPVGVGH